ncbi:hypothetical protein DXG01_009972, partial [Tephrocybe rancida]
NAKTRHFAKINKYELKLKQSLDSMGQLGMTDAPPPREHPAEQRPPPSTPPPQHIPLSCPATLNTILNNATPPCPAPLSRPARKATDVIMKIEHDARDSAAMLDFDDSNRPSDDALRLLLDSVCRRIDSHQQSLERILNQTESVVIHKQRVIELLCNIQSKITQLGALIPPAPPAKEPVMIASEPCNLIIDVMTMVVKMAMATNLSQQTGGAETDPEYTDNQKVVLDQLPTSLYSIIKQFNFD